MQIERILIPVDFSDCARAAVRYGLGLADRLGATVEILHVYEPPYYVGDMMVEPPHAAAISVHGYVRTQSEKLLAEMLDGLEVDAKPRRVLIAGNPASVIAEKGAEFDLVVMGTHGRTGLSHLLMGSVAEKVLRHCATPVLSVRATAT